MSDTSPAPKPAGKTTSNVTEAPPRREAAKAPCNVRTDNGHCERGAEWRGLCDVHRQTHRGLADADPDAPEFTAKDHPEVSMP